mmetsp:Transcript_3843/g.7373  ORF Transcript_3843/g.7373 Transcript_3843/m.7373 type:complete len:205 (-) Transcript_3843:800-1414(-)
MSHGSHIVGRKADVPRKENPLPPSLPPVSDFGRGILCVCACPSSSMLWTVPDLLGQGERCAFEYLPWRKLFRRGRCPGDVHMMEKLMTRASFNFACRDPKRWTLTPNYQTRGTSAFKRQRSCRGRHPAHVGIWQGAARLVDSKHIISHTMSKGSLGCSNTFIEVKSSLTLDAECSVAVSKNSPSPGPSLLRDASPYKVFVNVLR